MATCAPSAPINFGRKFRCSSQTPAAEAAVVVAAARRRTTRKSERYEVFFVRCSPLQQSNETNEDYDSEEDVSIICEPCNGRGWMLCDFCKGQKTNVKAENNRIYRRCPSCRAVGYVLCSQCKVFKCVTFPDYDDGDLVTT